jgi:hypothetical protein
MVATRGRRTYLAANVAFEGAVLLLATPLFSTFLPQIAAFSKWAMLDLNQRPPLCKLDRAFPAGFCAAPKTAR